ncbi:MAG: hypothetical protein K6C05_08760 [Anaerovibrio sp.]|uniref:hypothetical protein n=1 Tax=Anaerovibrio sp. TaxID=1872532 RepID=UPI0025E818C1|nr:hypothetical protein [Anaerovibrio sp.]MCR5176922.1 hypothetical protein [Anaerovibrio sp.]
MLDELQEFKQYTDENFVNLKKEECRLKYSTFIKHDFCGLPRAMTVVARQFIFQNADPPQEFNEEEVRKRLKEWCENWLPQYIRYAFLSNDLKELRSNLKDEALLGIVNKIDPGSDLGELLSFKGKLEEMAEHNALGKDEKTLFSKIRYSIEALNKLRSTTLAFDKRIFSIEEQGANAIKRQETNKNDYHRITYDRIIANALEQGQLHRYYLVCKSDKVPYNPDSVKKYTTGKKENGLKLSDSDKDLLLKFTAAYLLKMKSYPPGYAPKYMAIPRMDIANWMKKKDKPSNFELEKYKFVESREGLFDTRTVGSSDKDGMSNKGNITKTYIHPDWVDQFYIVDEKDIDNPEHHGRIFFSDAIGEMLCSRENKRYN